MRRSGVRSSSSPPPKSNGLANWLARLLLVERFALLVRGGRPAVDVCPPSCATDPPVLRRGGNCGRRSGRPAAPPRAASAASARSVRAVPDVACPARCPYPRALAHMQRILRTQKQRSEDRVARRATESCRRRGHVLDPATNVFILRTSGKQCVVRVLPTRHGPLPHRRQQINDPETADRTHLR